MKKTVTTLFLTTAIAMGFAQEQTLNANAFAQPTTHYPVDAQTEAYKGTFYMKMSASESELPKNDTKLMPGMGIGYRVAYGSHGFDISAEGNRKEIRDVAQERVANYSYTLPKVNYLYYVTPAKNDSFYAGAGLAIGGMKDTTVVNAVDEVKAEDGTISTQAVAAHNAVQEFHGFIPNAVVGYEFNRQSNNIKTFAELSVSQPALAVLRDGTFFGPKVAINLGIGY